LFIASTHNTQTGECIMAQVRFTVMFINDYTLRYSKVATIKNPIFFPGLVIKVKVADTTFPFTIGVDKATQDEDTGFILEITHEAHISTTTGIIRKFREDDEWVEKK